MSNSAFIKIVSLSAILFSLTFFFSCKRESKKVKNPNILFISIDDLCTSLGVFEDTIVITPNIDQLAAEEITFRDAFCQSAVCAPSCASLMMGLR